ncbi:5-bisphosphate_3-kinase catalytic subunit alpha/beta/delta [Hexamita inflata]|uniref:5-bisphosphate 3-kinase catalytic subunit alpha/beta/delta n=1 Tax=Hexamita inflata TaxID=28002 RepID=A0AA86RQY3_9EUKA|nr:5-bisphosphate 3-kinase catalytic subunit alpha/beta/delta [Hexamita inflata]
MGFIHYDSQHQNEQQNGTEQINESSILNIDQNIFNYQKPNNIELEVENHSIQIESLKNSLFSINELENFDINTFILNNTESTIQQEIKDDLEIFQPTKLQIPYYPHVILPNTNSQMQCKIIFSFNNSTKQKYEQQFDMSPHFSADEIACMIFGNFPDLSQKEYCLKIFDQDIHFIGMRPLIDYDFVREYFREKKNLIMTAAPIEQRTLEIQEYYFDNERACKVYQCDPKVCEVESRLQQYQQYIVDNNFVDYCKTMLEKFKDSAINVQKQALQINASYKPVKLFNDVKETEENKLNIELQDEQMEIKIKTLTIPTQASKHVTQGRKEFEIDITDYKDKYFNQATETADYDWSRVVDQTFKAPKLKQQKVADKRILKQQTLSNNVQFGIYQKFRQHVIQISTYLVYGSRNLSKCLYTQFVAGGALCINKEMFGIEIDFNQTVQFPIKYKDVPPGTKLAFTVWYIQPEKLVEMGNNQDSMLFNDLINNRVSYVTPEQCSKKLQQQLSKLSINPKEKDKTSYYTLGYAPIGGVLHEIFNTDQVLKGGKLALKLWPDISSFWLSSLSIFSMNQQQLSPIVLNIEVNVPSIFQKQLTKTANIQLNPIQKQASQTEDQGKQTIYKMNSMMTVDQDSFKAFNKILKQYANKQSNHLSDEDCSILFQYKDNIQMCPQILPYVLHAVPFNNSQTYNDFMISLAGVYNNTLPLETCMELLDFEYSDTSVRNLAFWNLQDLHPYELKTFTLQLVQSLKFERSTGLFKFLINTAVNDTDFGFNFYWALKSEMRHTINYSELYKLMMFKIVQNMSEKDRNDLLFTEQIVQRLAHITKAIYNARQQKAEIDEKQKQQFFEMLTMQLQSHLDQLNKEIEQSEAKYFKLPFSYNLLLDRFVVKKSRTMDSKKAPLMLFVHKYGLGNEDQYVNGLVQSTYMTMFKTGDDLRQDALVVQAMSVMNNIWLSNSLQLNMKIYAVVPTGPLEGMIEIVPSSTTLAKITNTYSGAMAAFSKQPIAQWLYQQLNVSDYIKTLPKKDDAKVPDVEDKIIEIGAQQSPKEAYTMGIQYFSTSCAAFAVATYILGIGDRHNDNVMMSNKGHFFHIDFGHFMGHFKKKYGIEREKAPFFYTPDMEYVMREYDKLTGGNMYQRFVDISGKAYNLIREKGNLLIVMIKMLVATGIEELSSLENMEWLDKTLQMDLSTEEADKFFKEKINEAVGTLMTQINNFCHIVAHK